MGVQPRQAGHSTQRGGRSDAKNPLSARIAAPCQFVYTTRKAARCRSFGRASDGRVGIYACGPTVYNRIHIGNARPFVVFSLLKRFLEHEGYDATLVANITDVNDKIYDAARPLAVPERAARGGHGRGVHRGHGGARRSGGPTHEPLASESIDAIVAYIQALIDRDAAYAAGGDVYFRVRADAGYGSLSHRTIDDMDQGEGIEGRAPQGGPARLRPVEGPEGGRGHGLGRALGARAAGLAHRVLGDGRGGARPRLRDPRRRQRPDVPPPRERGGADADGARGRARADLDAQRDAADGRREDGQVGRQRGAAARGARRVRARRSDHVLRQRPLPRAAGVRRRRDGAGGRAGQARARGGEAAGRRRSRPRTWRPTRSASSRRCATTSTRRRRWRRRSSGSARRTRAPRWAATTWPRCSPCSGWRTCWSPRPREAGDEAQALLQAREAARAARDFAEADRLRDELRASGWEVRDGPSGPELVPGRVIVYGRQPVAELLRAGRRRVLQVWATKDPGVPFTPCDGRAS